jgi:hypothetical protein
VGVILNVGAFYWGPIQQGPLEWGPLERAALSGDPLSKDSLRGGSDQWRPVGFVGSLEWGPP